MSDEDYDDHSIVSQVGYMSIKEVESEESEVSIASGVGFALFTATVRSTYEP